MTLISSVERMLAWRYLRARRAEGFISITTWFAIIGIALGVATLILVTSLMNGIREDFMFDTLPEDWDHFMPILENAMNRMPLFQTSGIHTFFNGPESFTPDDRYYLGEAPELGGYWVAAGYNSVGIAGSGGAGMALAHWIVEGEAPFDLWEVDIRRAQPFQKNRKYLKERVSETLGLLYADHFPYRQVETSRGVRRTHAGEEGFQR